MRFCGTKQRGMTLLEVLVALAVAAIGLLALYGAAGGGIMGIRRGIDADMALLAARSRLDWAQALGPAADGRTGEVAGGGGWRVRVRPAASLAAPPAAAGRYGLYDILVEVRRNGHLVRLQGRTVAERPS